ncbi:THAP domain-containing protein 4, partial [Biomphalaria pfeifferi]
MVNTCSAYGCKNSALTFGKHFFTFPKDPVLRKKWIIKTKRANFNPSSTAALCSDHFNETDFELRTRPSFLRSILLPEEQIKKVKLCLIPGTIPSNFNFPHKDLCTALDSGNNRKGLDLDFDKTSNGPVETQTKTAKIRGAVVKRERLRVLAEIDFGTTSSNSSQNIPSELSKSSNDGCVSDISQPSQIINESEGLVLQGNEIPPSSKRNDIPANSKGKVIPPKSMGNVIQPRSKGNVIQPRSKGNVIRPRSKGNVILPSSSKGPKGILILETLKSQNTEKQPSGRSILFLKRLESQESHVSQQSKPVSTDTLLHRTDSYTLKSILKDNTTDLVHQKSSTPKQ